MWSQINVRSSIRLTVSQQIDFKDFQPLKAKENIFRKNFKISESKQKQFFQKKMPSAKVVPIKKWQ